MNNLIDFSPLSDMSGADMSLAGGALLGILLLIFFLPDHHPYGALDLGASREGMSKRAQDLLGLEDERVRKVVAVPQDRALVSMQQRFGRKAAVDSLRDVRSELPLFLWSVRTQIENDPELSTTARFDGQGRLWTLSRPDDVISLADRRALGALQRWSEDDADGMGLSDTLVAEQFHFDTEAEWGAISHLEESFEEGGPDPGISLDAVAATRMAQFHFLEMGHAESAFTADSVWLVGTEETQVRSRTRFKANRQIAGYTPVIEIEVASAGMLWAVHSKLEDMEAARTVDIGSTNFQTGGSIQSFGDSVPVVTYIVLLFVMAIVFFRKLNARLIDVNTSLRDAVFGGALLALMTALPVYEGLLSTIEGTWPRIGILLLTIVTVAIGGGTLILVISAATDSGMRSIWPEKIQSLNLARRFRLYNIPVGQSLMRGAALAGCLLGILIASLMLAPQATMLLGEGGGVFLDAHVSSPILFAIANSGWTALLLVLLALMGVFTLLYRKVQNLWLLVVAAGAIFALLQVGPLVFEQQYLNMILSAFIGVVLVLTFLRYDAFTCFVGLFLAGTIWITGPAWMLLGLLSLDGGLPWLIFAGAIGMGTAGTLSGREQEEVENYVPTYVRDLSQRERLQHEIEIAQQVQQNLLPRSMPHIVGLDLAALCLPAQEVGGDYYDLISVGPQQIGVVVGDVSGKGIQAAFFMTLAKGFLQTLARQQRSPREVVTRLNRLFCENVPRGTFISLIYGIVDLKDNTFTFVRAGHNPLVQRKAVSASAALLRPGGMAIGLTNDSIFDESLEEVSIDLNDGDALVLYTDGFTEAVNVQGTQLGAVRFTSYIEAANNNTAQLLLDGIKNQVAQFIDGAPRHDDMTVVVIQLKPAAVGTSDPARIRRSSRTLATNILTN